MARKMQLRAKLHAATEALALALIQTSGCCSQGGALAFNLLSRSVGRLRAAVQTVPLCGHRRLLQLSKHS
jgi:hypothetical protein